MHHYDNHNARGCRHSKEWNTQSIVIRSSSIVKKCFALGDREVLLKVEIDARDLLLNNYCELLPCC